MAATNVQAQPAMQNWSFEPIIQPVIGKQESDSVDFDPKEHIAFEPPTTIIKMKDLGFDEDTGISPVAVSQPFKLFSESAIHQMRAEVLSRHVMSTYAYKSNIAPCQLRGYSPK